MSNQFHVLAEKLSKGEISKKEFDKQVSAVPAFNRLPKKAKKKTAKEGSKEEEDSESSKEAHDEGDY